MTEGFGAPAPGAGGLGGLYVPDRSAAGDLARGLAWLWKLGPVCREPAPEVVGIGMLEEEARLRDLVAGGSLAGAMVLAGGEGPRQGEVPARARRSGVARFDHGTTVQGAYTVFVDGEAAVSSTLGAHAVTVGDLLMLGIEPGEDWGRMDAFWAFEAIAGYLEARLRRPLDRLPAVGCLRLDDTPGTGLHQLQGRAKTDRRQRRRLARLADRLVAAEAVVNVAVVATALEAEERVPLERVWPGAVEVLRRGIERGAFEPICHGLTHLDGRALEFGEIDHREFRSLGTEEARAHISGALEWQTDRLATPQSFVAPGWAYGPAADAVAAEFGLIRWDRPRPGPLLEAGRLYESLIGELYGIHNLDYSPLVRLAAAGIPPVIAMHGALLDAREVNLKVPRDLFALARLFLKRDVVRLIELDGIRWVGARELIAELEGRDEGTGQLADGARRAATGSG